MSLSPAGANPLSQPVPRALLRLALPVLASQALRLAYQWVDALWVRGLGVEATAAITTSVFVLWWVYALNDVFCVGASAYVSQLMGAGDRARAGVTAALVVRTSAVLGGLVAIAAPFVARPIFELLDPTGSVVESGSAYLRIALFAAPLTMTALTFEAVMRAAGDTRTPLLFDLLAVLANAALAPLLIYGVGPFPRMGVAGAAVATAVAHATLVAAFAITAWRRHPALPWALRAPATRGPKEARLPRVQLSGLAKVGAPAALIGMLFSVVYVVLARAASPFGAAAVAVVGIVNRIEATQFILALSIGLSGATLVGQALGAGQPERAALVIRTGQRWILGMATLFMAALLVAPHPFLAMFASDPEVFRIGVPYLRIMALGSIATGLEIFTAEAVIGSGHTRAISWCYTIVSLLRIPLAFVVPYWGHAGMNGIAWLITITCVVRAGFILAWVARGTWRRGLGRELHGAVPPL